MITTGEIIDATITKIKDYGAFASLPNGETAMIHISEVSSSYVKNIHEHLNEGQTLKAKVISIDENSRINLSIKQAENREFSKAKSNFQKGRNFENVPKKQNFKADEKMSFEDMLSDFKKSSDEKLRALKKSSDLRK